MVTNFLGYLLRFLVLFLMQVLVLNLLNIYGLIAPNLYPLFILWLPIEIPYWLLLLAGFFSGLTYDMFSNTAGLNAGATTMLAFVRPVVLRFLKPAGGYEQGDLPRLWRMRLPWFISYSLILFFVHNFYFVVVETFSTGYIGWMILKIISGTLISTGLALLTEYLLFKRKKIS